MSARSFRVLWALEELGFPYDLVMLPFPPRQLARGFLELNPAGTVPFLVHDGTGMTESAAICQYLCSLRIPCRLQIEPGQAEYGSYLNMLHFGEATLTFPQTIVLRYSRFEPAEKRQPAVACDYEKWFLARLKTLERRLEQQEHLCAVGFTMADVSVGYALMLGQYLGLAPRYTPAVAAYWLRLERRDAFARSLQVQKDAALRQGVSTVPAPLAEPSR